MNRKGDADIVATVLLIVGAIAMALLVTTFSKQTEEKVSERIISVGNSVECEDVRLSIDSYTGNLINLTNRGTLGVKGMFLRVYGTDPDNIQSSQKNNLEMDCGAQNTKDGKLLPQKKCLFTPSSAGTVYKIEVIPVVETEQGDLGCENKISTWQN